MVLHSGMLQANGVTFRNGNVMFTGSLSGILKKCNFNYIKIKNYDQTIISIDSSNFDVLCDINNQSSNVMNAIRNYWGDASGPYHAPLNPSGQGSKLLGNINFIPFLTSQVITGIGEYDNKTFLSLVFKLYQNYPNPFNPATKIKFALPERANVKLTVYNLVGVKVTELVNSELAAGYHEVELSANNFPSGIYFYELTAGKFREVKKMILLK